MDPARKELIWWDNRPAFSGASVFHSRKAGNLDIVCSYHGFQDAGYRENEYERRNRINLNLLYRNKKVNGLSYGINSNGMIVNKSDFFLWQDADSGAYRQNESAVTRLNGFRLNIDPFVEYYNDKGGRHTLKARYFRIVNEFKEAADKNNESSLYMVNTNTIKASTNQSILRWVHPPRMQISHRSCMETIQASTLLPIPSLTLK